MTRQLYRISDAALLPYPRPDDEPVIGLDRTVYRVVTVVQLPAPPYDPTAEQLSSTETYDWLPDGTDDTGLDGTLTRGWQVDPIVPPPPPEPAADWLGWAGWLYGFAPMASAMAAARASSDPLGEPATTGLPTAMDEARLRQNYQPFALSWAQFIAASALAPTDLAAIIARATACHLPAPFIAALSSATAP